MSPVHDRLQAAALRTLQPHWAEARKMHAATELAFVAAYDAGRPEVPPQLAVMLHAPAAATLAPLLAAAGDEVARRIAEADLLRRLSECAARGMTPIVSAFATPGAPFTLGLAEVEARPTGAAAG